MRKILKKETKGIKIDK